MIQGLLLNSGVWGSLGTTSERALATTAEGPVEQETTSAVIQHLYARKAWFVEGAALHETAPLLP